jgi:hypothetical protein
MLRPEICNNPFFRRQAIHSTVDDGAEFGCVLHLASLCQSDACIVTIEPGGVAPWFIRRLGVRYFQQESLHDEFLDATALRGDAFGVEVEVKMLGLDDADGPGLFQRLALRGLAVG